MKRQMVIASAQLGPVNLADSKESVVQRLIELMREAAARGARFIVFPELALTTFFPRYWLDDDAEVDARFFDATMPSPVTNPLFDQAIKLGVGFYIGYGELTHDGERTRH